MQFQALLPLQNMIRMQLTWRALNGCLWKARLAEMLRRKIQQPRQISNPIKKETFRPPFLMCHVSIELLHNELDSIFKTVSLDSSEVDAAVEVAEADLAVAENSVDGLFHNLLASDVVDSDVHFRSL